MGSDFPLVQMCPPHFVEPTPKLESEVCSHGSQVIIVIHTTLHPQYKLFSDCLSIEKLFAPDFGNFVYTAPTSAGKTLVAEIVAACNVLHTAKRALFVFPFISSAREKYIQLQTLWRSTDLVVKAFIGASSASMHGWSAAVCTIEKANALVNAFIETDTLDEICTVVIDELHMLFDTDRGGVVENIICKLLYAVKQKKLKIQIIGMSATLEEYEQICAWMNATSYVSNFRPLKLQEHVFMDSSVYEYPRMQKLRDLQQDYVIKSDTKGVIGMTMEAVMEDKAVLIFCSTKAECERNAALVGKYVSYCLSKGANNRFDRLNSILAPPHQKEIVDYFAKRLCVRTRIYCRALAMESLSIMLVGLTVEEREEIEFLFRKGSVKILVATSTLSSGVNLPAHRVLILTASNTYISLTSTYKTKWLEEQDDKDRMWLQVASFETFFGLKNNRVTDSSKLMRTNIELYKSISNSLYLSV